MPAALLTTLAFIAVTASGASARLYDRTPPRVEAGLEVAFPFFDADDAFAALGPGALFGVALGLYVAPDIRAGFVVRAAIADSDSEHFEALADLTWSWVAEPRLSDPPALRLALSMEFGWRATELHGSDFVVADDGMLASVAGEIGVVLFEGLCLSLQLAVVAGPASNDVFEGWSPKLRAGLALATLL